MTPTDFWLVCPTNQLRLSDNSMCHGPSRYGVNCLRHVVSINQPKQLASRLNKVPSVAIAGIVWSMKRGAFSSKWYTPLTVALHNRPAFLRERMNKLAKVFAPTSLMKEVLLRHGLEPNKVRLLPYGINLSNVKRLPKKREPKNRLRLGFIGTLYEHKGPHVLISAIKKLNDFNGVLKIYGNESEFPSYVETLKQTSGTDRRIQFVGTFPNNQIGEVFSDLDALVVPSIWYENTPLVIYSAQAAGCPVVASNLGGMSEVIEDGINGRLFTPGNADELASIIEQLDANRTLLDRLGMNSRQPTSSSDYVRVLLEEYCSLMSPALV